MSLRATKEEYSTRLIFGRSEGSVGANRAWRGDGATAARRGTPRTPGCSRLIAGSAPAPGRGRPPTVYAIRTQVCAQEPGADPGIRQWRKWNLEFYWGAIFLGREPPWVLETFGVGGEDMKFCWRQTFTVNSNLLIDFTKQTFSNTIFIYHWPIQGGRQRSAFPGSKFFYFCGIFCKKLAK